MRDLNEITAEIIDAAYGIHTGLGPGLLESVYEAVLARELERRGLTVERQRSVSFEYNGLRFDEGFRVDLLIDGRVVVELKCVEKIRTGSPQAGAHVPAPPHQPVGPPEFRGSDTEGRHQARRQSLHARPLCRFSLRLCASACKCSFDGTFHHVNWVNACVAEQSGLLAAN